MHPRSRKRQRRVIGCPASASTLVDPAKGSDSLKAGGPQTGEGSIDDRPSGCSRRRLEPAACPGRTEPQAAGPGADRLRQHVGDGHSRQLRGRAPRPLRAGEAAREGARAVPDAGAPGRGPQAGAGHRRRGRVPAADDVRVRDQGLEALGFQRPRGPRARHVQHDRGREGRHADLSPGRPHGRAERADAQGFPLLRRDHPPAAPRRRQPERRGQPGGIPAARRGRPGVDQGRRRCRAGRPAGP